MSEQLVTFPVDPIHLWCNCTNVWFSALPVTFITPLSDFTIPEGDNVTFKCVTSKPEKVQWFKNGKKITKPDKRIQMKDDGVEHTLTIDKSLLDDGAEYSAKIADQSTAGKLTVEGITACFISDKLGLV